MPTPLLDFTRSPYIAAFFAFADAVDSKRDGVNQVRIVGFTQEIETKLYSPNVELPFFQPYITPLTVTGRNNPRLHVQQGQFLVTNVKHAERFLRALEIQDEKTYLFAADVPVEEAAIALEDLNYMGLSAASMFPGLDGVSRSIKYSMLFRQLPTKAGMPSDISTR